MLFTSNELCHLEFICASIAPRLACIFRIYVLSMTMVILTRPPVCTRTTRASIYPSTTTISFGWNTVNERPRSPRHLSRRVATRAAGPEPPVKKKKKKKRSKILREEPRPSVQEQEGPSSAGSGRLSEPDENGRFPNWGKIDVGGLKFQGQEVKPAVQTVRMRKTCKRCGARSAPLTCGYRGYEWKIYAGDGHNKWQCTNGES